MQQKIWILPDATFFPTVLHCVDSIKESTLTQQLWYIVLQIVMQETSQVQPLYFFKNLHSPTLLSVYIQQKHS